MLGTLRRGQGRGFLHHSCGRKENLFHAIQQRTARRTGKGKPGESQRTQDSISVGNGAAARHHNRHTDELHHDGLWREKVGKEGRSHNEKRKETGVSTLSPTRRGDEAYGRRGDLRSGQTLSDNALGRFGKIILADVARLQTDKGLSAHDGSTQGKSNRQTAFRFGVNSG